MAWKIYEKIINGKSYYYLQRTYRVKINEEDKGKTKGSGKSKVKTESIYLGSAEEIHKKLMAIREPMAIKHKEFGLVAAAYKVAEEIGLISVLQKYIKGKRYGIDNWKYFLISIINRIDNSTSKEKMGKWAEKTVLPQILNFKAEKLNSQSFWYATDDVISESELKERRGKQPEIAEDIFAGIDDTIFKQIQKEVVKNIQQKYQLISDIFLYDTTNFFTFFKEPLRSLLARATKSKVGRNNLKHTALALSVDKHWGIPLFHSLYRGNSHDSKTFSAVIDDLIEEIKDILEIENMILIIDKGNNSEENFSKLKDKIDWIGSLKLSDYQDLIAIELEKYTGNHKNYKYYSTQREIMGVKLKLVLTYNEKLYRKQLNSLNNGIEKLKNKIIKKCNEYKRSYNQVPKAVKKILSESYYGKYIEVNCEAGKPVFKEKEEVIRERKKSFGKTLLFASNIAEDSCNIIDLYHSKDKIEDGIKLLKNPHLISWQPMRHWTDSKIRAFAFSNIMALTIIRIMEYKATIEGLKMSPQVLKQELKDLKEIILIYDKKTAQKKISEKSTVQKKLYEIFKLYDMEKII